MAMPPPDTVRDVSDCPSAALTMRLDATTTASMAGWARSMSVRPLNRLTFVRAQFCREQAKVDIGVHEPERMRELEGEQEEDAGNREWDAERRPFLATAARRPAHLTPH